MNYGFYYLSGFLFVSGVLLIANTEDNNSLVGGAVLIMFGLGFIYVGRSIDDWKKLNTRGTLGFKSRPMANARLWYGIIYYK